MKLLNQNIILAIGLCTALILSVFIFGSSNNHESIFNGSFYNLKEKVFQNMESLRVQEKKLQDLSLLIDFRSLYQSEQENSIKIKQDTFRGIMLTWQKTNNLHADDDHLSREQQEKRN